MQFLIIWVYPKGSESQDEQICLCNCDNNQIIEDEADIRPVTEDEEIETYCNHELQAAFLDKQYHPITNWNRFEFLIQPSVDL